MKNNPALKRTGRTEPLLLHFVSELLGHYKMFSVFVTGSLS